MSLSDELISGGELVKHFPSQVNVTTSGCVARYRTLPHKCCTLHSAPGARFAQCSRRPDRLALSICGPRTASVVIVPPRDATDARALAAAVILLGPDRQSDRRLYFNRLLV